MRRADRPAFSTPAPFVDLAFSAMERPTGPLDFALLLELRPGAAPDLEALRAGAERAFAAYPRSRCRLEGTHWRSASAEFVIDRITTPGASLDEAIAEYLSKRMDLSGSLGIAQRLFVTETGDREVLVLRMHHALGDMQSAATWLQAQLAGRVREQAILLARQPKTVRKSRHAFDRPSESLWRAPGSSASGRRRFHTRVIDPIRTSVEKDGFTWNDLLTAVALETFARWNSSHGASDQVGCWIPMNVRARRESGFGNGASRIRVYRRAPWPDQLVEAAKRVRAQVRWSKDHGEWNVPAFADRLSALPRAIAGPIVRAYARRPRVDWATGLFSHAERLGPADEEALPSYVARIGVVSHLYSEHPMAIAAVGHLGRTHLTFTWDEALFPPEEAKSFLALYESIRARGFAELGHA